MWRGGWLTFVATHHLEAGPEGRRQHGHDYGLSWLVEVETLPPHVSEDDIRSFFESWVQQVHERCLDEVFPQHAPTIENLTHQIFDDFHKRFPGVKLWIILQETPYFGGSRILKS